MIIYTACSVDEYVVAWVGNSEAVWEEPDYVNVIVAI